MPERETWRQEAGVEARDLHPGPVLKVAATILVVLAAAAGAIWGLLHWWELPVVASANVPNYFLSDGASLQAAPQDERAVFFAEKQKLLGSYGWVDRRAGTARIPIEVAMDLMAARNPAKGKAPSKGGAP